MRATVLLPVLALSIVGTASPQPSMPPSPLQQKLLALSNKFLSDWQTHDMASLSASLAPDFLFVSSRGTAPKEGVVGALSHCSLSHYSISEAQLRQTSAQSATLIYRLSQTDDCSGVSRETLRYNTDTFRLSSGRWLFVLTTETDIPHR